MSISVADRLPEATFLRIGADGPEQISTADLAKGRKIALFAVPGAFTRTCQTAHVPSYIAASDALKAKGVDEIVCVSVNDPFVMAAWGEATGATVAGLTFLADADGSFTRAMGLSFDAPPVGLIGRSKRYAMLIDDGVVSILQVEENPGVVEVSGGDALLNAI